MLLKNLIDEKYQQQVPVERLKTDITCVCSDSRLVRPGGLFVALEGAVSHGSRFITDAVGRGAGVIVHERGYPVPVTGGFEGCLLAVDNPRKFLTEILRRFYDDPSRKIKVVGITGTNGKTTLTYLLEAIFRCAGKKSGVIGTINHRFGSTVVRAANTTPGITDNFHYLSEMVKAGADYCFMETSSHALVQQRVDGIAFHAGIFTNLTGDHLDYHKKEEDYFLAKARLFEDLSAGALALINLDDSYGPRLTRMTQARVITYSARTDAAASAAAPAAITAADIRMGLAGTVFMLKGFNRKFEIKTGLFGLHSVYNILAAAGLCLAEGVSEENIQKGLDELKNVPGRMESVPADKGFHVFIDYAHTEDALKNVLRSIRDIGATGKTILVFGCGGDRDRTKRPKMGRAASKWADFSIVTSDNPRQEEPADIIAEIVPGFENGNFKVVPDRREAIYEALKMARPGDIVLIAGKGHEDYQILKDKTVPFNEKEIVREFLARI